MKKNACRPQLLANEPKLPRPVCIGDRANGRLLEINEESFAERFNLVPFALRHNLCSESLLELEGIRSSQEVSRLAPENSMQIST